MKTVTYFTTCNGATVTLSKVGLLTPDLFKCRNLTPDAIPANVAKHARSVQASGGGRPTEYAYYVGVCSNCSTYHVAERIIERPANASNHVCNGRCMSATGKVCECSCRGKNHGAGSNFSISIEGSN